MYLYTLFSEIVTFKTVTDALNYSGNREKVTGIIITDSIAGNDYSPESEWSKFRTLDETFPNIESVEICTDQDMPLYCDVDIDSVEFAIVCQRSLFFCLEYDDKVYEYIDKCSKWLKEFSAPNIRIIGEMAFAGCDNLFNVDFSSVMEILNYAFSYSNNLKWHCYLNIYNLFIEFHS